MNDRIFNRLTEISVALKSKRQTGRTFHTTFILEKKRIISIGINNLENFMLQSEEESKGKDRVELCLSKSVCAGRLSLDEAQKEIWRDWRQAARLCSGFFVIDDYFDSRHNLQQFIWYLIFFMTLRLIEFIEG